MKAWILFAIFGLGLCSCTTNQTRDSELDDIREAAFLYMFGHNNSGIQQKAGVYFLAFYDPVRTQKFDPSAAFLGRFRDHRPRVAGQSEARDATEQENVRDKVTGEKGLVFYIRNIRWNSGDTAEVDSGYDEGMEGASWNTLFLEKKSGRWFVKRDVCHGGA